MAFAFDKLDQLKCDHCGGAINPDDVPADPPVKIGCPHCKEPTIVPGKLGTLLVNELIGKGAAGMVYKALDTTLQRWVAVKLLHPSEGDDKQIVEATVAEAGALAALNHPNVVHVHTIGMRSGQPFIVMELLLGSGKLNVMLKEGWVADEQRGLEIGVDIAQALKASWNAGLLHRDVKPGNILFNDEGVAKLLDFSVVVNDNADEKVVIGTPYYISPEAAKAEDVDYRSDLYSLGATLFHLMTGSPPFAGESQRDLLRARLREKAPDIRSINPQVSAPTAAILARLLERDPDDRYQSHDELVTDLREALASHAMMPSGASAEYDNELAAIGSAASEVSSQPKPMVTVPRADDEGESSGGGKGMLIGGIAAGLAIVIGIIIAVAGGGGDDNKDALAKADGKDAKKSIFDEQKNKDATKRNVTTKDNAGKDSTKLTKNTTGNTTNNKDGASKSNGNNTKDGKQTPANNAQQVLEEKLAAWDQQTTALLTKAAQRQSSPWVSPPIAAVSQNGATITPYEDGSLEVIGTNPPKDVYTVTLPLDGIDVRKIKALRLEALLDLAKPAKGSGRSENGNFVITGFEAYLADESGIRPFNFGTPLASYQQPNHPVAAALDGKTTTGWGVYERQQAPNEAIFPVVSLGSTEKESAKPDVVFETFEAKAIDKLKWKVDGGSFSKDTVAANALPDSKALEKGFDGQHYLDSRNGGSGNARQRLNATGTLESKPFVIQHNAIKFKVAGTGKAAIHLMVDGKPVHTRTVNDAGFRTFRPIGWDVRDLLGKQATIKIEDVKGAFIAVDQIVLTDNLDGVQQTAKPAPRLLVKIKQESTSPQHTLGRFRVSYTTEDDVFIEPAVSDTVRVALLKPKARRNSKDAADLLAFFVKHVEKNKPYLPPLPKPIVRNTPTPPTPTPEVENAGFTVAMVRPASGKITKRTDVIQIFQGKIPVSDVTETTIPHLNLSSGAPAGIAAGDLPFPPWKSGAKHKEHFAVRFAGILHIPEAGDYTFLPNGDDFTFLILDSGTAKLKRPNGSTFTFAKAGRFPIIIDYAQAGGTAFVELLAAKGDFQKPNNTFRVVGDTKNGGLAVSRPNPKANPFAKLAKATKPTTPTTPTGSKTEQSPGTPAEVPKHAEAEIDPSLPKYRLAYQHFDIEDPDARVLIPRQAKWQYWSSADPVIGSWTLPGYNAGGWYVGEAGFGIRRDSFTPTTLNDMLGKWGDFYARTTFQIENVEAIGKLRLLVRGADPCIVYVNGKEAARTPGLKGNGKDADVTDIGTLTGIQSFNLTKKGGELKKGTNWIALECHNRPALTDRNFRVDPILVVTKVRVMSDGKPVKTPRGWKPLDLTATSFPDAVVLKRNKNNPRFRREKLEFEIASRKPLYFVAYIRAIGEAKGHMTLVASCKQAGNNKPFTLETKSHRPIEADDWERYIFEIKPDGKRGRIEVVELKFPKTVKQAEIKWIGYAYSDREATVLSQTRHHKGKFWDFTDSK